MIWPMAKVLRDHLNDAWRWATAAPNVDEKSYNPFETKSSSARAADFTTRIGIEHYPPRKYAELYGKYRSNPIVRRCTKLCAEAVAKLEPIVKVNGKEDARAAEAIKQWFKRPNPGQSRFTFVAELTSFFKLSGNGWIEAVGGVTNDYLEQYALRPERMGITPGADGRVRNYTYRSWSGRHLRMQGTPDVAETVAVRTWGRNGHYMGEGERSRIFHIKDFAADDDLFGVGALEACESALDTYEQAEQLARNAFKNGAVLAGAFTYAPNVPSGGAAPVLTPEQREDLKKQMREKTGTKNAGKYLLLQGGLNWESMSSTLVDLQAEEIRNNAARDICRAFGVPSLLLGIPGDLTFANFEEGSRAFYRNTVFNDATRIFESLAHFWGTMTKIDGLELVVDEDKVWALAEELERYWNRILSAGEVLSFQEQREAIGWDELPDPTHLMRSPMGGFATVDEMVNSDYGLYGPRDAQVIGNEPLPAPKK